MICHKRDEATYKCKCCGMIMCRVCDPRAGYRYFPPSDTRTREQDTREDKSRKAKVIQRQMQQDMNRIASRWIPRGIIAPSGRSVIKNKRLEKQLMFKREFTDFDHLEMGIDDIPADACAQDEVGYYYVVDLPKRVKLDGIDTSRFDGFGNKIISEEEKTKMKEKIEQDDGKSAADRSSGSGASGAHQRDIDRL